MFADAFLPVQNLKRLNIFNNYKLFSSYFYKSHTGPALSSLSDTIMDIEFGSNVFTAVPWDALQADFLALKHVSRNFGHCNNPAHLVSHFQASI